MKVAIADLQSQHKTIRSELAAAFEAAMDSCDFGGLGKNASSLESEISKMCGAAYGLGVNSGTDALLLALLSLDIGPGDEVITSPFTFFATAETISLTGAKPVFADINPGTYNIDPDKAAERITSKTKAILPVHLFGQLAEMERLTEIARDHNLSLVGDGAQAIGASRNGKLVGEWCNLTTLSFYPTKNLGACGDAGMILTDRSDLADRIKLLRFHGSGGSYYHNEIGYCSRLDGIQAALLQVKARYLSEWNMRRQSNAGRLDLGLEQLTGRLRLPCTQEGNLHVYHQYTIRVLDGNRDALQKHLASRGVQSAIYYPLPLHLQAAYNSLGYRVGDLPESELATHEVLSLPVHPHLTHEQIDYVIGSVSDFFSH